MAFLWRVCGFGFDWGHLLHRIFGSGWHRGRDEHHRGGDGNDHLEGGRGDDRLYGRDGNDRLEGGRGDDRLYGGDGADHLEGGSGDDRLYGEDGNDTLSGGSGDDRLYGGDGDDTLSGGSGRDRLDGEDGSDTYLYDHGDHRDRIRDSGNDAGDHDRIVAASDGVTISLEDGYGDWWGIEEISAGGHADVSIEGSRHGDWLDFRGTVLSGIAAIDGGGGSDWIFGTGGSDHILGGSGRDRLFGQGGADILEGGRGDDWLDGGEGSDTYVVGHGDGTDFVHDTGTGAGDHDVILADGDGVRISLEGGFGPGNGIEEISAGGHEDVHIRGSGRSETLDFSQTALDGIAWIDGSGGNDRITGSAAADTILGGSGRDTITGGAGADQLWGGSGRDTFAYGGVQVEEGSGGTVVVPNLDITGTGGNDDLTGAGGGGLGHDTIDGGEGDDTMAGGSGNDILTGGRGHDVMDGGDGRDVFVYNTLTEGNNGGDTIVGFTAGPGGDVIDVRGVLEQLMSQETDLWAEGTILVEQVGDDTLISISWMLSELGDTPLARLVGVDASTITRDNFIFGITEPEPPDSYPDPVIDYTPVTVEGGGGPPELVTEDGGDTIFDFRAGNGGDVLDLRAVVASDGVTGVALEQHGADSWVMVEMGEGNLAHYITLANVDADDMTDSNWLLA